MISSYVTQTSMLKLLSAGADLVLDPIDTGMVLTTPISSYDIVTTAASRERVREKKTVIATPLDVTPPTPIEVYELRTNTTMTKLVTQLMTDIVAQLDVDPSQLCMSECQERMFFQKYFDWKAKAGNSVLFLSLKQGIYELVVVTTYLLFMQREVFSLAHPVSFTGGNRLVIPKL